MAYDPWDWTNSSKPMNAVVAPLAAMPIQTGNASMPNPVNTTGPLQQMVQQQLMNQGFKKAFEPGPKKELLDMSKVSDIPATTPDPSREVPMLNTRSMSPNLPVEVGGPMAGGGESMVATPLEPMAPLEVAEATGADIAGAETATATAGEAGTLESLMSSIGALFAADGTTSVPNKAKGGK